MFTFDIREHLTKKYFVPLKPDSGRIVYELLPLEYAYPENEPRPIRMEVEIRNCDSVVVYTGELSNAAQINQVYRWDGKDNAGEYTDPQKSPYLISITLIYRQRVRQEEPNPVITDEEATTPNIESVHVVSGTLTGIPTDSNKIVPFEQSMVLSGVIKAKTQEEPEEYKYYLGYEGEDYSYYPDTIKIKDEIIYGDDLRRWDKELWGALELEWQRVKPRESHAPGIDNAPPTPPWYPGYTNVNMKGKWLGSDGYFHGEYPDEAQEFDIIEYDHEHTPIDEWFDLDIGFRDYGSKWCVFGVNYEKEELKLVNPIYSPGERYESAVSNLVYKTDLIENAEVAYYHGIELNVHRISRKSSHPDTYIQSIESYYYVPWIWGSAPEDPASSQTERFVGFDCSDLLVGAYRQLGYVPDPDKYGDVDDLKNQTEPRGDLGELILKEGKIRKKSNPEIPIVLHIPEDVQIGDLILLNIDDDPGYEHSLALYGDIGIEDILDKDDRLICAGTGIGVDNSVERVLSRYSQDTHPSGDKVYFIIQYWSFSEKQGGVK